MTTALPPALGRALELLAEPPAHPDVSKGYLDLLADGPPTDDTPPRNTGAIQAAWASDLGSMLYDNAQALARRLMSAWQHPIEWLNIPPGGVALDVGSGPGNVTASLARAAGPDGLALGVDISEPMLARAVSAQAGPQRRLPSGGCTAASTTRRDRGRGDLHRHVAADTEPGGGPGRDGEGAALRRPDGGDGADRGTCRALLRLLPDGGVYFFTEDELGDTFEELGLVGVRTKSLANFQWVRAKTTVTP